MVLILTALEKPIPSPLMGEGQGGGENCHDLHRFHPHPNLPPSRGKEFLLNFVTQ